MERPAPQLDQSQFTDVDLGLKAGMAMQRIQTAKLEFDKSKPSDETIINYNEVIEELTNQLREIVPEVDLTEKDPTKERRKAWKNINNDSLVFMAAHAPIIPKTAKKKEIINRKPKMEDCAFFITGEKLDAYAVSDKAPAAADRIVSWCVLDPATNECAITVCFNVDEVRNWMSAKENQVPIELPSNELLEESKNSQLPTVQHYMFHRDRIQDLFQEQFRDNVPMVPEFMTPEFEIVIREFDLIPKTQSTLSVDRVLLIVQKFVTDYFQEKVESSTGLTSAFWKFTKVVSKAAIASGRLAWKLAQNPLLTLIVTTVAKMVRVFICVMTNVDNAVDVLADIAKQFLKDAKSMSSGITKVLWELTLSVASCAKELFKASMNPGATLVNSLLTCMPAGIAGVTQGFFMIIKDMLSRNLYKMLQTVGLPGFANFGAQVFEKPGVILRYLTGNTTAAIEYDIAAIVRNYEIVDFQKLGIFLFMYITPVEVMGTILSVVTGLMCPALAPVVGVLLSTSFKGMNVLTFMKYLFKQGAKVYYVWQLLDEISEWVFDMIACTMNYFIDLTRHYFRVLRGIAPDPNAFVSCCMTKVIQDLIQAVNGDGPAATYQREVIKRVSSAKRYLLSWVPGGKYLSGETEEEEKADLKAADDVISAPPDEMFVESDKDYDGKEFNGKLVSGGGMMSRMYAALCDEREKIKLDENPVFQLATGDGKLVNFYMFIWKPDAFFRDEQQMHVSVMAQEIEKIYPDAVLTFGKRKFLLLERLPREVINYILYMRNPIFDFNQLLSV